MPLWLPTSTTSSAEPRGASRESLQAFREIGQKLIEAKEALRDKGKGAFGDWCEVNGFGFHRSWRAKIMKLAESWDEIARAVEETEEADSKVFSVDAALACWAKWKKANDPEAKAKAEEAKAKREAKKRSSTEEGRNEDEVSETEALRQALKEALRRIQDLEAEVSRLRQGGKEQPRSETPRQETPRPVDAATKTRARKVYALYTKGATEGERNAAKTRLEDMARKHGMDLSTFLKSCGL
ncbi:DUF2076 domain-containing protein [Telmatospirillum sp. J64-1]|uniref:DUF2076 domain-containing protein n=1 Tax=Telmatospirillum sp. J64-1 TaxID=2502183 RepID=UPI00115D804E|nr:DUF2076 domain-containing protein [Telmatospirillum sp. J64-1]